MQGHKRSKTGQQEEEEEENLLQECLAVLKSNNQLLYSINENLRKIAINTS